MASIFSSDKTYDKTYVLLLDSGETYMQVRIEPVSGKPISNDKKHSGSIAALISGANITANARTQETYTLGTDVYMYTFGESLYDLTISGMGYIPCDSGTPSLDELIDWYDANNVGKHGLYCTVMLSKKTFKAYLTGYEIGCTTETNGLFPFRFQFKALLN